METASKEVKIVLKRHRKTCESIFMTEDDAKALEMLGLSAQSRFSIEGMSEEDVEKTLEAINSAMSEADEDVYTVLKSYRKICKNALGIESPASAQ